jgi:hypothetical protein
VQGTLVFRVLAIMSQVGCRFQVSGMLCKPLCHAIVQTTIKLTNFVFFRSSVAFLPIICRFSVASLLLLCRFSAADHSRQHRVASAAHT